MSNQTYSTKTFRKRFHMLAIPAKMEVVAKIKNCLDTKTMPSGNPMEAEERTAIYDLLIWCDVNIFFDTTPSKWDEPKY